MLIDGISYEDESERMAEFLKNLKRLDKAYIAVPTRPPTEKWVKPAQEETINAAFHVFSERLGANKVECLIGYEGNAFAFTGRLEEDLLSITDVQTMRVEAKKANADWNIIEKLLQEGKLRELEYEGHIYYMRKLCTLQSVYK
jgi:wyosine [tRNA(Phe)-imidazoG37] synthetase (radical SAM superfamily)